MSSIKISDYIITKDELYEDNKIYDWCVDGVYYTGAVKDFVETMGKYQKYIFVCNRCKTTSEKTGVSIINKGLYCTKCSHFKSYRNRYDLSKMYPFLKDIFNEDKNKCSIKDVCMSDDKTWYWFKCLEGHEFQAHIVGVIKSKQPGHGCPVCFKENKIKNHSVLKECPEVAKLWNYDLNKLTPDKVSHGAIEGFWFTCPNGHNFVSTISHMKRSISSKYKGCPMCAKKVFTSDRSLAIRYPEILKYWDYDKNTDNPYTVRVYTTKKYWFKCSKGHSYYTEPDTVFTSKSNYHGCPICTGRKVIPGVNDLETQYNSIVSKYWSYECNDTEPCYILPHSTYEAWWKCSKCGKLFIQDIDTRVRGLGLCENCRNNYSISGKETGLYCEILKVFPDAISQYKVGNRSYDIYIPDKNYLIEFNGLYFHSEANHPKDKNYQYNKLITAKENGYSFYAIWEDDWDKSSYKCLQGLYSKLGVLDDKKINARDCTIEINNYSSLLDEYHIQGNVSVGCNYLILKLKDEVVSELAFKWDKDSINIVRFVSKYNVRGGFSKLLKYLESLNPFSIYTFSDNAISEGNLYKLNGFDLEKELPPDYSYVYKRERVHKFNFRKERFMKDDNLQYKEGLSESALASLNGIYRIWDYGKKKWVKIINNKK